MKRRLSISHWLVALFSLSLLIAPAGWAAQKIFVNVSGIPGESTDANYKDWIDASLYSDGVFFVGSFTGQGGGQAGRSEFDPIRIVKSLDKASPKLRQAAAAGKHINNVTIDIIKPETVTSDVRVGPILIARIVLTDVLITEVSLTVNLSDLPQEAVTFDFLKIMLTYYPRNLDGSIGTPVIFSWDRQRNIP